MCITLTACISDLNASLQTIRTHNKCDMGTNSNSVYLADYAFSISDALHEVSYLSEKS